MTFLSLSFHRSDRPSCQPCTGTFEACHFERRLMPGLASVGGILTWLPREGTERRIVVAMTWDVLAQLRAELEHQGLFVPDDVTIRACLCYWGIEQYRKRLTAGVVLPSEGLLLDCLGGPQSPAILRLLHVSGLLAEPVIR